MNTKDKMSKEHKSAAPTGERRFAVIGFPQRKHGRIRNVKIVRSVCDSGLYYAKQCDTIAAMAVIF